MPFDVNRFVPRSSTRTFYVPPSIQDDFKTFLFTDVPNANWTLEKVHDWSQKGEILPTDPVFNAVLTREYFAEHPELIRAEIFPINWKTAFNNADNTDNFRTHLDSGIQKGDIFIREDREYMLGIWAATKEVNNIKTQAQLCNMMLTVTREVGWEMDEDGKLISETGKVTIAGPMPVVASNVSGKYEYVITNYTPGIVPNNIATLLLQFNPQTDMIRINDEFIWHGNGYKVINIERTQLDIREDNGILILNCDKIPGENYA